MRNLLLATAAGLVACASSAQAAVITYSGALSGATETVPTPSLATGTAAITLDTIANTLKFAVSFTGLSTGVIEAHVHCCTTVSGTGGAGVATLNFAGLAIPIGATSGSYAATISLTSAASYNSAFLTAAGGSVTTAEAALAAGLAADKAYVNLHTNAYPSGEIEAFLTPASVPEPAGLGFAGIAVLGLAAMRRRDGAR